MAPRRQDRRRRLALELDGFRDRPLDWLRLTGSRLWVAAGLLVVVAAIVWGVVLAGLAPLTERTPLLFLLFALISGNVTLITIVVSISQFVLSRHLESPGEIRQQLRELVGYREEVGETTGERVLPVTPGGFMTLLVRSVERDVDALQSHEWHPSERRLRSDLEPLVSELAVHVRDVTGLLERGDTGVQFALFAILDTNYGRYFYGIYRVRAAHQGELPPAIDDTLTRLERHVEQVDVARRYFKTVLIQSNLASLSRMLLYIGLPVLVVTVVLTLLFTDPAEPPISRQLLAVVIPAVVTAGFAPLVLLAAYIVRLATVVERTAAMYPFTTRFER